MSDSLTPTFMDKMASMMLARAMQTYEADGLLLENLLLLNDYSFPALMSNMSTTPWYRNPALAVAAIVERRSVAAILVTPASAVIIGPEMSAGKMVLAHATYPGGSYRRQLLADVAVLNGEVTCKLRLAGPVLLLEKFTDWLDEALGD